MFSEQIVMEKRKGKEATQYVQSNKQSWQHKSPT